MLCRDLIYDWWSRDSKEQQNGGPQATQGQDPDMEPGRIQHDSTTAQSPQDSSPAESSVPEKRESHEHRAPSLSYPPMIVRPSQSDGKLFDAPSALAPNKPEMTLPPPSIHGSNKIEFPRSDSPDNVNQQIYSDTRGTLYGLCQHLVIIWKRLPFPTVKTVLSHLPFALIPFAFCMFIIVEGLVTKGWVEILAKGWAIWANKSNAAVAIAGMGFVSVCLCNVSDPPPYFFCFCLSCSTVRRYKHRGNHSAVPRAPSLAFRAHTVGTYGTWDRTLISAFQGSPTDTLKYRSMPWRWVSIMAPLVSSSVPH